MKSTARNSVAADVHSALAWLKRRSSQATLAGMAGSAIPSDNALGVAIKDIKALGKRLEGRRPI